MQSRAARLGSVEVRRLGLSRCLQILVVGRSILDLCSNFIESGTSETFSTAEEDEQFLGWMFRVAFGAFRFEVTKCFVWGSFDLQM